VPDETPLSAGAVPPLGWTALYLIVAGALVLEIGFFAVVTWIYR
jgi:hypothetical protein